MSDSTATSVKLSIGLLKDYLNNSHTSRTRESALRSIGYEVGEDLSRRFVSSNLDDLVRELSLFWKDNDIGEIQWKDKMNGQIVINCLPYGPKTRNAFCFYEEGLLQGLISSRLKQKIKIRELDRYGPKSGCIFKIDNPDIMA